MRRLLNFILPLFVATVFVACDDDNDSPVLPNPAVQSTFSTKYVGAKDISWEHKNAGYWVADFQKDGKKGEAWFADSGVWEMTNTEITVAQLPAAVKAAFDGSIYKTWTIDDVDMVDRKDLATVYVIEVELGEQDRELWFTAEGELIRDVVDVDDDQHYLKPAVPQSVTTYLATNYATATVVDIEIEADGIDVDLREATGGKVSLNFSKTGTWIASAKEILSLELVPTAVQDAVSSSLYAEWRIEDIALVTTPAQTYYLIEFEEIGTEKEGELMISPTGEIIS